VDLLARHPLVPGVILLEQGNFVGMISRRQVLECWIRPHGLELFPQSPLHVLQSYCRAPSLTLAGETPILAGAQQALRRSPELLTDPILVQTAPQTYFLLDSQTLTIAYWQLRGIETQVRYERTQAQMVQSDKMANLGRLVDGVAHEILDPVSFIWGNLSHFSGYSQGLLALLSAYETLVPTPPASIVALREDLDVDYLREDLPRIIESVQTGAERLSKLASSLQNFCHIDAVYPKPANLHEMLDGIILLLKSRLSQEVQVIRHYDRLPPIPCYAGLLHQVFMNLLVGAVERLLNPAVSQQVEVDWLTPTPPVSAKPTSPAKPAITLTTRMFTLTQDNGQDTAWVYIGIHDNGTALTEPEQSAIRASFGVAQRAAKETSLAVSYQIITAKHGGKLELRSPTQSMPNRPSSGTEFEILLPLV
jgi:signal transduction histidine kinase